MRTEDLSDGRLDEALRSQPRWEPPGNFARAVIARLPVVIPATPPPRRASLLVVFRAAAHGLLAASVALAAGLLLWRVTLEAMPGAIVAAAAYQMLLKFATFALIDNATIVAWISAAVTLSIAASVTGGAREWM
jgi:DNA-binding transcriptional LysR family regulator